MLCNSCKFQLCDSACVSAVISNTFTRLNIRICQSGMSQSSKRCLPVKLFGALPASLPLPRLRSHSVPSPPDQWLLIYAKKFLTNEFQPNIYQLYLKSTPISTRPNQVLGGQRGHLQPCNNYFLITDCALVIVGTITLQLLHHRVKFLTVIVLNLLI